MVRPVQASCWPMRLERWTLPGLQQGLQAWPELVWRLV